MSSSFPRRQEPVSRFVGFDRHRAEEMDRCLLNGDTSSGVSR